VLAADSWIDRALLAGRRSTPCLMCMGTAMSFRLGRIVVTGVSGPKADFARQTLDGLRLIGSPSTADRLGSRIARLPLESWKPGRVRESKLLPPCDGCDRRKTGSARGKLRSQPKVIGPAAADSRRYFGLSCVGCGTESRRHSA
jgi:hypothetical protein